MSRNYEKADASLRDSMERYLAEMFGLQGVIAEHWLWRKGEAVWVAPAGIVPPGGIVVDAFGMLVTRRPPPRGRLSAPFIRTFCQDATDRVCELDASAATLYLSGHNVSNWADPWADGIRIVRVDGHVVGRARVKEGVLICELPKELRVPTAGG